MKDPRSVSVRLGCSCLCPLNILCYRDDLSLVTYTDRDHYPERSRIMKRLWHGTAHSSVPCAKYADDVLSCTPPLVPHDGGSRNLPNIICA